MKRKHKIIVGLAFALIVVATGWWVWFKEQPREAFIRVVGIAPPPSVTNIRALSDGGMQTWEDVLVFRIAADEFPLLLRNRPFAQVPESDFTMGIDIETVDQSPNIAPVYFETPEFVDEQFNYPVYTIRTNAERTSVVFRRIDGQ